MPFEMPNFFPDMPTAEPPNCNVKFDFGETNETAPDSTEPAAESAPTTDANSANATTITNV